MSLQTAHEAWMVLQTTKLKHLRTWNPEKDSLDFANMTSIPAMAKALNTQMSAAMDVEEIHQAAHVLAKEVAALPIEDFYAWNRQEVERAQQTGQLMSQISSTKLMAMMGFAG